MARKVRYAVVGLGHIAQVAVLPAFAHASRNSELAAFVSDDATKLRKLGTRYGVAARCSYDDFEACLEENAIDAVYIALPNNLHREYTLRAAAMGVHVLCEKPMAVTEKECEDMIDACREASVKLMIAYRIQYEPLWAEAVRMIRAGEIGEVESFQGGFFNQQRAGAWRLNKKLAGGGPIFDLGVYPLNAIRMITGEEPKSFTGIIGTREAGDRFAEVEQSMEWGMKFPSGIIASCSCSYGARAPGYFRINGSNSGLIFEPAFNYDGLRLRGMAAGKPVDIASTNKHPYMFTIQAEHFANCVRNNEQPRSTGEDGLKDLLAIEAIYKAAGSPIA